MIHLDSSVLIDLLREHARERPGPAFDFFDRLLAVIERGKRRVPAMDLLIATAAVVEEAALVTRNARDFSRVPGLRVLGY